LTILILTLLTLRIKLRKYYKKTEKVFVYSNDIIFQSRGKLSLFKQYNWDKEYIEKYSNACRERYINEYKEINDLDTSLIQTSLKQTFSQVDNDDNEYEDFLLTLNLNSMTNEYDW